MLEEIETLPSAEEEATGFHGNGELGRQQGGTDMGGHVVRPLFVVTVAAAFLRRERAEEIFEIAPHFRRGILLNEERGGGMADEER